LQGTVAEEQIRSSWVARTHKPAPEVIMRCFAVYPQEHMETQKVEIYAQEAATSYDSNSKSQQQTREVVESSRM